MRRRLLATRFELIVDRLGGRGPMADQGAPKRGDDPLGVRVLERQRGHATGRTNPHEPALPVAFADPPQDRVDETAGPL